MAEEPTAADVAAYLGIPAPSVEVLAALADAVAVAIEAQAAACVVDPYTEGLAYAATRRAARVYAARQAPLGQVNLGDDYGVVPLPRWDAEVRQAEAPYLRGSFA